MRSPAGTGRRFGVKLDPDTEVQPLVGSKEGIFHLPVAFVDPGDVALIPDPGYPVYETGTILAGGEAASHAARGGERFHTGPRGDPGGRSRACDA